MFRIIVLCLAMINYAISVQVPLMPKKQVSFLQSNTNEACNWQCYLDRYVDLQNAFGAHNVTAAELHWAQYGQGEGRDCTCGCNWQCYLDRYVDLQNAFGAHNVQRAELHWAQYGQGEGRDCQCASPEDDVVIDNAPGVEDDVVIDNAPGVGGWGGSCTCPSGAVYQVGDNMDYCDSLACIGGQSGQCNQNAGAWSGRKVTCAQ